VAGQVVGMATGLQDRFSWRQVALAGLGSVVTGGLPGSGLEKALQAVAKGSQWAQTALLAAANNAITQGLAVATGLQSKFDWKAVATSAVAAPLMKWVRQQIASAMDKALNSNATAIDFSQRVVAGVLQQGIRMAVYGKGKLDFASIAADAFGSALGNGLMESRITYSEDEAKADTERELKRLQSWTDLAPA